MNFLKLCQDLRLEAMVPGNGPPTVIEQRGIHLSIVEWIRSAWTEIQELHNGAWDFLRNDAETNLQVGVNEYQPEDFGVTDSLDDYDEGSFQIDIYPVNYLNWTEFKRQRLHEQTRVGRPITWTRRTDGAVQFYPIPNDTYELRFWYKRQPQELLANEDEPLSASPHHKVIVWRALMHYARVQRQPDLRAEAMQEYERGMMRMQVDHLPEMRFGRRGY